MGIIRVMLSLALGLSAVLLVCDATGDCRLDSGVWLMCILILACSIVGLLATPDKR